MNNLIEINKMIKWQKEKKKKSTLITEIFRIYKLGL